MDAGPEAALRAWVEYLRDQGIYDLYRRDAPGTVLPPQARTALMEHPAARERDVVGGKGVAAPAIARPQSVPVSRPRSPVGVPPAASRGVPVAARAPGNATSSPPSNRTYFAAEAEHARELPPELAAPMPKPNPLENLYPAPVPLPPAAKAAALAQLQAEIGDCTRCPLAYAGRHTVVFGEGDPNARLMFVGEGPGAEEDASGRPFVGKAGQLLNNMIGAMGLAREQVYIANVVKCRPPANRAPEFAEATTCSQFLLRQIDMVRPEVIVALGTTAATYVLGVRQPLASLRGQWLRCREAKVAVTFHPAFLLRDPRQKAEAWKDLQRVMVELGLRPGAQGG